MTRATERTPFEEAMAQAGRTLARRAHSEKELRSKMEDLDEGTLDDVIRRLRELKLLDDRDFAQTWIEERRRKKGSLALAAELRAKGVPVEIIDEELERISAGEEPRAVDMAARHLPRVAAKPLEKQAAAIESLLLRRGFEPEIATAATRAVLPPEGWD